MPSTNEFTAHIPAPHGLLVLDKPVGMTSRNAVDRALRWFPQKTKIGHTGTLDPLARGVLVLCIGHATRLTEFVQGMAKTYIADVTFGARSVTDDAEGPITPTDVDRPLDRAEIEQAMATFIGFTEQMPPAFSAAKVAGRRAYALARSGTAVALAPRTVRIDSIDILEFDYPHVRIEVHCGKGTYIRSLARDLGESLGCGAYVSDLRRTRVGPFDVAEASSLEMSAPVQLLPPSAAVADLRRVTLAPDAISRIRNGQSIPMSEALANNKEVAVFDIEGALVAITVASDSGNAIRPSKVFPA